MKIKPIRDLYGVIADAFSILPVEYHTKFIQSLCELEDNECHKKQEFPHTRLHKVKGCKQSVFRADIDKISGWRLHLQFSKTNDISYIDLCDIIEEQDHDDVLNSIKSKKNRYK